MSKIAILLALLFLGACTIAPKPVKTSTSFDGTNLNSGFLYYTNDGSGIITPRARDRYNSLIVRYGDRLMISKDYGITPEPPNFRITPDALVKFATMNRLAHSL